MEKDIQTVRVVLVKKGIDPLIYAGKKIMTRKDFKDFVYRAFFYRNTKIVIGDITFSGRTVYTRKNDKITERVIWYYEKATSYLWEKVRKCSSFQFFSEFENTNYIIEDN